MTNLSYPDERLMSLCELALSLPAPEREVCIRAATAGDESLCTEVLSRAEWEERLGDFLLEPLFPRDDLDHPFTPGQLAAGRFEIVREVAEGGMAVVYEAIDQKLDQRVAIKCTKTMFRRRLPPEARTALRVSHSNICRVHGIHEASTDRGAIDFLTMEFLDGETLLDRLRREKKLPIEEVRNLASQVCAGLDEAHRKGIVHGDLKPSNIILTKTDGGIRAVITDFGLAKQIAGIDGPSLSRSSGLRGTPDFVAPELWRGSPISVASDIYALGVILYEALTGVRPWAGEPLQARFETAPRPPLEIAPGVPAKWSRVVLRCLDPDPAKRPASAAEMVEEWERRGPWVNVGAVVIALCLLAALLAGPSPHVDPQVQAIRLAVLPFESDSQSKILAEGTVQDLSNRLVRVRRANRGLVVIPPAESIQNHVRDPKAARAVLGATHSFQVRFQQAGGKLRAHATVWNNDTEEAVSNLTAEYSTAELGALPKALLGTISAGVKLRGAAMPEVVQAAAYNDYARGLYYLHGDAHNADQAIPYFQRAAQLDPNSALPFAGIAEAQLMMFQASQDRKWVSLAEEALKAAQARNPDAVEVHLAAGLVKQSAGRLGEAIEEFRYIVQREPENPDALRRLAGAFQALKLPEQALQIYHQVISLQPTYYKPHSELGTFFYNRGQYANALSEFQNAARLAPGVAQVHHNVAAVYIKLGAYKEAEGEFREALRLNTTRASLAGLAAVLSYEKRYEEAVSHYEESLKAGPVTLLTVSNLGDSYRRCGRGKEAQTAYKKALELADEELLEDPGSSSARAFAGYLSARLGDRVRAERETRQAIKGSPDSAEILWRVVLTFEVLGNRDASLSVLESAPKTVVEDLSRQPDLADLQQDPRFINLGPKVKFENKE